jgi:hypothetical protein
MSKLNDLTGRRFGRLTAIARATAQGTRVYWVCMCDCGTEKFVRAAHLYGGKVLSCGCLGAELASKRAHAGVLHKNMDGHSNTPAYSTFMSMRQRCNNKNNRHYHYYGGRGITICERWREFANFFADMGDRPPGYSLDRINPNGHYEPSNCRWVPKSEQPNNTRANHLVTHNGKTQNIARWAKETGIPYKTIAARIAAGETPADALGRMPTTKRIMCRKGHRFTPENTVDWYGARMCKTCLLAKKAVAK